MSLRSFGFHLMVFSWLTAAEARTDLFFVANRGQAKPDIRFMVQSPHLSAYFKQTEIRLKVNGATLGFRLVGANPAAVIEGRKQAAGRANFLVGTPEQWTQDIPVYEEVLYRGIYPGIDMTYGGADHRLKSEFIVAPGADPGQIRFVYIGVKAPARDDGGALILKTRGGVLREEAPVAYQQTTGVPQRVESRFEIFGDGSIGFILGEYDRTRALIIDPPISFSTYFGGVGMDSATAIATDTSGNVYMAGWTESADLRVKNQAQANQPGVDAFVAKFSADGQTLVYCTYLGGGGDDRALGMAVNSSENVYITGWTTSVDFPAVNAYQRSLSGARNAFVAKLNASGNALVYSTYFGGKAYESGNGIAIDSNGSAYVIGETTSSNLPVQNPYQGTSHGATDAFVLKLLPGGTGIVYSTYLGGRADDRGRAIAVDSSGAVYITGDTWSSDFPIASAFQSTSGGNQDAFVAKLNPSGGLAYSSYLGGTGGTMGLPETGAGIAVDAQGNAYVTGTTSSFNFRLLNALQSIHAGSQPDAFVAKVNATGSGLIFSTYLGGSSVDVATSIAVDPQGLIYVGGYTASVDFPTTAAGESVNSGGYDGFFVGLSADGGQLLHSMCLGGSSNDAVNALTIVSGAAYLTGQTLSLTFPLRNATQLYTAGTMDAFLTKLVLPAGGSGGTTAATFIKADTTTQGSWKSGYGVDGFNIAGDATSYPAYAQVSFTQTSAIWASSTSDGRALQKSAASDRIAANWYSWSTFSMDINILDAQTHQMALYFLDWDSTTRAQTIDVLNASTSAVLDTRSISGFSAGRYLVWNITGHVVIRVTRTAGPNAVLSGIFFGGALPTPTAAVFVRTDSSTQGSWKSAYGVNGYSIAGDATSYPAYAQVSFNPSSTTWAGSTTDVRALQKTAASDRVAAAWYSWSSFSMDVNFTDKQTHQMALYFLDWDSTSRAETVDVLDAGTGAVLDTRSISGFGAGVYLVWNLTGHAIIRFTRTGGPNAVLSGCFFGAGLPTQTTATFVKTDTTTQGSWKGVYGSKGFAIANDSTSYPSFAQVTLNLISVTWTASTADARALLKAAVPGRIASTWYTWSNFGADINFTDGQTHQVAMYFLDWDSGGRSESVDVLDAVTGALLDHRTMTAFSGGQYLVWNLSGHVAIRVKLTAGMYAVASGIFF